ncbi:hypothetical protein ES708_23058 [subsurface metagenome]
MGKVSAILQSGEVGDVSSRSSKKGESFQLRGMDRTFRLADSLSYGCLKI